MAIFQTSQEDSQAPRPVDAIDCVFSGPQHASLCFSLGAALTTLGLSFSLAWLSRIKLNKSL